MWLALGIGYVMWGSTYLGIKVAQRTIPPLLMASVRFLIAGALLYAWSAWRRDRDAERPTRPQWRAATITGALLFLGGNGGVVLAEQLIPTGLTALLVATVPLWMVLASRVFLGERLTRRETLGLAAGLLGVVLLTGLPHGEEVHLGGVAIVLGASVAWAAGSLYDGRAPVPAVPSAAPAMQMLAGGVLLGLVGAAAGELGDLDLSRISGDSVLALAYLIAFGSLVAFSAYAWLLRSAPTPLVVTYAYVNPVVAVLLGVVVLDERLTAPHVIAGLIVLVAVAIIVTGRRAGARVEEESR